MSPDSRYRPQSSRVQHQCPGRARQYRVPAGRVFSLQATRLVSSTRRPVRSEAITPRSPGRPQPGLEAVAAVLHGQAGPALLDAYHTMNGTRSDCSLYAPGLCPVRLPHGSRRRGAPLIDYGAVTMGYRYRSSTVLTASEDISPLLPPRSYSGRAWYTGSARSGQSLRLPGDFHHRPVRKALRTAFAGTNGAAWISAADRVTQQLGVPLDVRISLQCGAERC
jgi:hypothetical protein